MKTCWILIFVSLFSFTKFFGQTENKEFAEAEDLLANDRFVSALPHYLNLLNHDSSNANLNFKIGICYLNSRSQKSKAIYFLNKALAPTTSYYSEGSKKQTNEPIVAYKFLGTCHLSFNFEQSQNCGEKFRKFILDNKNKNFGVIEVVNLKMGINKIDEELNGATINLKIENKTKNLHSFYIDYSSTLSSDQPLIFTFQKQADQYGNFDEASLFFENNNGFISQAEHSKTLRNTDSFSVDTINNINGSEATVSISEDKQTILTYKDDAGNGNSYISRLYGNQWTKAEKIDKAENTKGWESNECISADGTAMYFTSDRKGGFGGTDIYKCKKLPNGEWGKATNLGSAINTSDDERAPFIHTDGITLYFSSNRNKAVKNFDIFTSTLSDKGNWSKPINVGYPANKIEDSISYPVTADNNKNSSPSSQKQRHGQADTIKKDDNSEKDNYIVTFMNQKQVPITIQKAKVIDFNEKVPQNIEITISDNETGAIVSVYNSYNKTGNYVFILPPEKNNNITYTADGYLFHSDNVDLSNKNNFYEINKAVQMPVIAEGSKIILNNIFFDSAKATLRPVSKVELNNIFHLLSSNPNWVVEISDYVILLENRKFNKKLAKERAQALYQYLIEKGISKENIIVKGHTKSKDWTQEKKQNENNPHYRKPLNEWIELKIVEIK